MTWDVDLAKEFKNRNNVTPTEPTTGKVDSINPLSVSIFDGGAVLTGSIIQVSKNLKKHTGTCTIGGTTGTCEIDLSLKVGDSVLCIPTNNGQRWYIAEVVE